MSHHGRGTALGFRHYVMTFLAFRLLGASGGGFSEIYTLKVLPGSEKNIMSYSLVNKLWTKDSLR